MYSILPSHLKAAPLPHWPAGVGGIPAFLADGREVALPVLPGVNALTFGVVGTGKTRSYTLPAAEKLLAADLSMRGVFFEVKQSFLHHFLGPGDKIITHNPGAVPREHLFVPNLIREIRQAEDREGEMRQMADFLFGELLEGAGQNRAWVEAARNSFLGVLRVIVDCFPDQNPTNRSLAQSLRDMTAPQLAQYLARHPGNRSMLRKDWGYDPSSSGDYTPTRRAGDILFFLSQVLESFSGTFADSRSDTIRDYMDGRYGRNLFFLYDLASAQISRSWFLYYLKKIKDSRMSLSRMGGDRVLMVLDEIDKLSDGSAAADWGIFQAANLGREYGLQLLVTTQSVENLYALSPGFREHPARGGLSGFPMVLSFRPGDSATIDTLQRLWGSAPRRRLVLPASRYGEEPGPDRAVRVPLRRYGRDRGVVESMCKLVEEYLGQAGPATVVILDDGRGDRSFLAPFLAALPGTAEAHLLSWDLFSLPEPELAPVLSAFPVRVYSRHESGASCARVAAQCGQLEVVKCSSSVTVDHRLGAASAWDLLLGTNRTTTQVRNAPVKEYRFRPEVVQSLGPGMGIIDCGGQHTLFQF